MLQNPLRIFTLSWLKSDNSAPIIAFVAKILQVLSILIMIIDVVARLGGKNLNSMHLMRYVTFTFCASVPFVIGYQKEGYESFYRGTILKLLQEFYDTMYYGYFDTSRSLGISFTLFPQIKRDEEEFGFVYVNILFVELVFYLLLAAFSYMTAFKLARRNKLAHFINSLRFVYGCSFGFIFVNSGVRWWKQSNQLQVLEKAGSKLEISGWSYWLSWIMTIFMFAEMLSEYAIVIMSSRQTPLYKLAKDPKCIFRFFNLLF